jgi:2-keto-4-pentenoate hydratase/2-oxohepta-3-ene-1,7-dioic acid hydratase in catechol pathway
LLSLAVNGEVRQSGRSDQMLFSIPQLIAYLSGIFTLEPGDLVFTGTPAGVGPLLAGDRLVAELGEGKARLAIRVEPANP